MTEPSEPSRASRRRAEACGRLHDLQLLRDVAIINQRTMDELGPLPPGGVPVQAKRRPTTPQRNLETDVNRTALNAMVLSAAVSLSACVSSGGHTHGDGPPLTVEQANAAAPFLPPLPPVVMSGEEGEPGDPVILKELNVQPVKWPLRFKRDFGFGARCINTQECVIPYDGLTYRQHPHGYSKSEPYSRERVRSWRGRQASFGFLDPVQVSWRAMDGTALRASIDLGEIFQDRLVLHAVPREEVDDTPGGEFDDSPYILVEVNDRTINVYMRALVHTRHLQRPGQRLSGYRHDLILAQTYRY